MNFLIRILLIVVPFILSAEEDFISHYEYGEMLYVNPRGISCSQCHGKKGEGRVIVEYRDIHGKEKLKGSDIRNVDLENMIDAVNTYHEVMPRYYLTNNEVQAIYDYIKSKNNITSSGLSQYTKSY